MATASPLLFLLLTATVLHLSTTTTDAIGVNYGTLGYLQPPAQVANFLKTQTIIDSVKIFDVNPDILKAFANSGVSVTVTVPNGEIPNLVNIRQARRWVGTHIKPFYPATKIKYISLGNEILLSNDDNLILNLVPAMKSLHHALILSGIKDVKVTSAHALNIIAYELNGPPSAGRFRPGWDVGILAPMLQFLRSTKSPFMINPYSYFGFDPANTNFATFGPNPGVIDPVTKLKYTNMFDTLMDSTYSAMKALGYDDVDIVIGETGWPTACDQPWCNPGTAAMYNKNVIERATRLGTPMMPNRRFDIFIFALFKEDLKPGPTAERNWGMFQPDFTPIYDIGIMRKGQGGELPQPAQPLPQPVTSGSKWCVAKPEATIAELQSNIDYVCSQGVDCKAIQAGGSCFKTNDIRAHAAYVMNAYYKSHGSVDCNFSNTGLITPNNPSNGGCVYI